MNGWVCRWASTPTDRIAYKRQGKWQFVEVMLKGLQERAARHKLQRQRDRQQRQQPPSTAATAAPPLLSSSSSLPSSDQPHSHSQQQHEQEEEDEAEQALLTQLRASFVRSLLATPGQMARGAALRLYYGG